MDPRESNRGTRRKSKWVQDLIKEEPVVAQEVEHVLGRDQGVVMEEKSTTDASSAHGTKKSATDVPNTRKEEEIIHMDVELVNKLNEIQQEIDSNQKKQLTVLNQLFTKAKEVIDGDKVKIASLGADNRYYARLSEDIVDLRKQLKKFIFCFLDKFILLTKI